MEEKETYYSRKKEKDKELYKYGTGILPTYSCQNKEFYQRCKPKFKGKEVDYSLWKDVISSCNKKISEIVIEGKLGFNLQGRIGLIRVQKKKMRKPFIVFKTENGEKNKGVTNNLNTFQYYYTMDWIPTYNTWLGTKKLLHFKAPRFENRAIKKEIDKGRDYLYRVDRFTKNRI